VGGIGVDGRPTFVRYRNPCPMNHAARRQGHPLAGKVVRHLLVRNSCDGIKRENLAWLDWVLLLGIEGIGLCRRIRAVGGNGRYHCAQPIKRCVLLISQLKLIVAAALCHLCLLQESA
jgi:hypothetical protein